MAKQTIFRIHGSAMEPCFHDGEFVEVDVGLPVQFARGGVGGPGAEIVVRYANGRHELVEFFGHYISEDVEVIGHVVRRVAVVGTKQKVFRIDAKVDTRWRERRDATRTLYPTHGLVKDVGPTGLNSRHRRSET